MLHNLPTKSLNSHLNFEQTKINTGKTHIRDCSKKEIERFFYPAPLRRAPFLEQQGQIEIMVQLSEYPNPVRNGSMSMLEDNSTLNG